MTALKGCRLRDTLMDRADAHLDGDVPMTVLEMEAIMHYSMDHRLLSLGCLPGGSVDGSFLLKHKDEHGPAYDYRVFQVPDFDVAELVLTPECNNPLCEVSRPPWN